MEDRGGVVTRTTSSRVTTLVGRWDISLMGSVLILTCLGLLLVLSTTMNPTIEMTDARRLSKFITQLEAVGIGLAVMLTLRFVPAKWLWRASVLGLAFALPLFVMMKAGIVGESKNGSARWIMVAGTSVQPSEFVKLAWAVFVCAFIARREQWINSWKRCLFWITGVLAPFALMLVIMKDVGSAVIMAAIMLMMLLVAGLNLLNTAIFGAVGVIGLLIVLIHDNVKFYRILAYLFPEYVRQGIGYQLSQSELAIGAGGPFGAGLGHGIVHVWSNLPESENDMIIAVAGEELGFAGLVCICILYAIIAVRGIMIARAATSPFRRNLAFVMTMLICLPAAMHLCVNVGLIPAKGLVCPFLSAGGSAMITSYMCVGVLQRLAIEATGERVISRDFVRSYETASEASDDAVDGGVQE